MFVVDTRGWASSENLFAKTSVFKPIWYAWKNVQAIINLDLVNTVAVTVSTLTEWGIPSDFQWCVNSTVNKQLSHYTANRCIWSNGYGKENEKENRLKPVGVCSRFRNTSTLENRLKRTKTAWVEKKSTFFSLNIERNRVKIASFAESVELFKWIAFEMHQSFLVSVSVSIVLFALSVNSNDCPSTIRQTANGPVEGLERISSLGQKYYSFRGIPFAEPPITGTDPYTGQLVDRRYKAPVSLQRRWTDPLKVHEFEKTCSQLPGTFPVNLSKVGEDCLFLNVHVPGENRCCIFVSPFTQPNK